MLLHSDNEKNYLKRERQAGIKMVSSKNRVNEKTDNPQRLRY